MAPEEPLSAGIADMESLFNEAAAAFQGERTFSYPIGGKLATWTYTISPDASALLSVRALASDLQKIKTPPPVWLPYWGAGLSMEVASGIAWCQKAKVRMGDKELSQLDLLRMARVAGPVFVMMSEEIRIAMLGVLGKAEAEVVEEAGED
jgi:hypothetical protein